MSDDLQNDLSAVAGDAPSQPSEPVAEPEAPAAPAEASETEVAAAEETPAEEVAAAVTEPVEKLVEEPVAAPEPAAPIVKQRVAIVFPDGISDRVLRDIVQLCNIKCVAIKVHKEGEE